MWIESHLSTDSIRHMWKKKCDSNVRSQMWLYLHSDSKMIGLFCKRALYKRRHSETNSLVSNRVRSQMWLSESIHSNDRSVLQKSPIKETIFWDKCDSIHYPQSGHKCDSIYIQMWLYLHSDSIHLCLIESNRVTNVTLWIDSLKW